MAKDLFSEQAKTYARYRPSYPVELFEYILQFVEEKDCAWDCATGNGQAAVVLSHYFKKIEATDLSKGQIDNAVQKDNINYRVRPAEGTDFPADHFDLITVAQAYHWIDWNKFHKEAMRVGKKNCVVAVWAYNLFTSGNEGLNNLLKRFYFDIVGPYWDWTLLGYRKKICG
jgi:ubiquinone/menaquinone biosynthesis C-methylase UbiE